jgi:schlafen family protein/4-fold beta-flower domain-containing protein
MASPIRSASDVDRLVTNKIPEGPALEYKLTLLLSSRDERREALKDLSGMGNGGGGTILIGIEKNAQNPELPSRVIPLSERSLVGRVEDIVRAGIRPPLLVNYTPVDYGSGFVLVVDILRSPLGPYMVEGYGTWSYFKRSGSRTEPMSEQEVRDAYALAARAQDRRGTIWDSHRLPMPALTGNPLLLISGLPEEPLTDVMDLTAVTPDDFRPSAELKAYARQVSIPRDLRFWAEGLHGELTPTNAFRLHRDGAVGFSFGFGGPIHPRGLPRYVHAHLVYLAWLWNRLPIRTPVEIRVDLRNLDSATLAYQADYSDEQRVFQRPATIQGELGISLTSEHLPWDLRRARTRHRIVREFDHRVHQAFGFQRAPGRLFTEEWLYGSDGAPLGYYVAGGGLFTGRTGEAVGDVCKDGTIYRRATGTLQAYIADGVVLDTSGNAIAAVEMAAGGGLPDDFLVQQFVDAPCPRRLGDQGARQPVMPPVPTGQWSGARLTDLFPYP